MILYQGKSYPNSEQEALLKTLQTDCFNTLASPNQLSPSVVIEACERLTQHMIRGDFDALIHPMLEAHDLSYDTFLTYVSRFTKEALETKLTLELGEDYQHLAPLDEHTTRSLEPLGILFHIAAGNLDILPAYSVMEGCWLATLTF